MIGEMSRDTLSRLAASVGLHEVGVTGASPFPELIPWLQAYSERGRTGFEAANIEDRIQPKRWMKNAKSIIVATMPYLTDSGRETTRTHPTGRSFGSVSCYAYGQDYHRVLNDRLKRLHEKIEDEVGHSVETKLAVDTSPLVDRRVAERAGIGWIGRNSMFYSQRYGSYVFIGALLVDIEFNEYADGQSDIGKHCGTCSKCMVACPTGAIIAQGVIDATRCLSYITQMKGIVPKPFRQKMGRRIWGCDICQTVCPENRGTDTSSESVFGPDKELAYPELVPILHLSNKDFIKKYGHTAVAWRGVNTLKRNAIIALGNTGCRDAIPELIPFLQSPRGELRASAAWALGKLGGDSSRSALLLALEGETDVLIQQELYEGVGMCDEHD